MDRAVMSFAPDLGRDLVDHAKLRPLLVFRQHVALLRRGEAALRRETKLLERREFPGLIDAALDRVLLLQRARLGGDEPEHHDLVAFGQMSQRLPAAGAPPLVFGGKTAGVSA